ncbi:accessory gland protein Acp29AB [Drosophila takahashii]|uniref:accessory gland protein Acp29AB n=1 Tax=Drosophila takahashii TaxID=29030 RepID=UPI001CF8E283|nr:accessory gland protein Acp29AB [Drosophila takahashii]
MQSKLDTQLTEIKKTLSTLDRNCIPPVFERIGERYFYIQEDVKLNWTDAADACRRIGGHLASVQSREEFDAIAAKLEDSEKYFLGINDREVMGKFVSEASGRRAAFFKWYPSEPRSTNDREHCLAIKERFMFLNNCTYKKKFICQADDKI